MHHALVSAQALGLEGLGRERLRREGLRGERLRCECFRLKRWRVRNAGPVGAANHRTGEHVIQREHYVHLPDRLYSVGRSRGQPADGQRRFATDPSASALAHGPKTSKTTTSKGTDM